MVRAFDGVAVRSNGNYEIYERLVRYGTASLNARLGMSDLSNLL